MEIIHINNSNRESFLAHAKPSVFALGFFDGMHLGHQQVIKTAKKMADEKDLTLVTMSFFPHPKELLSSNKTKVPYLMPLEVKERVLRELGVQKLYIVEFDQTFASLSPKEFVHQYLLDFRAKYIVAGFDFTYGFKGAGHMDRLKMDADEKLEVVTIEKMEYAGKKISSTIIRELIHSGKMVQIPHYLGELYQVEGKVIIEKQMAVIHLNPYYLLPEQGIYEVTIFTCVKDWQQLAYVIEGQLILMISEKVKGSLTDMENVRIEWGRKIQNELSSHLNDSTSLIESLVIYNYKFSDN